jgi:transposase
VLPEEPDRAGQPRADSVARKIVLGLPTRPIANAEAAATRYDVTPTAARGALNRLQETGVLVPTRVGRRRDREWISDELFQLLDAFEHDLGRPTDGEEPRPAPPTHPTTAAGQRARTVTRTSPRSSRAGSGWVE